jgi:hypothetical protein
MEGARYALVWWSRLVVRVLIERYGTLGRFLHSRGGSAYKLAILPWPGQYRGPIAYNLICEKVRWSSHFFILARPSLLLKGPGLGVNASLLVLYAQSRHSGPLL